MNKSQDSQTSTIALTQSNDEWKAQAKRDSDDRAKQQTRSASDSDEWKAQAKRDSDDRAKQQTRSASDSDEWKAQAKRDSDDQTSHTDSILNFDSDNYN